MDQQPNEAQKKAIEQYKNKEKEIMNKVRNVANYEVALQGVAELLNLEWQLDMALMPTRQGDASPYYANLVFREGIRTSLMIISRLLQKEKGKLDIV